MSPGGLGSDLAGSIPDTGSFLWHRRLEADDWSRAGGGQFPPSTGPYSLGAVIGPMARTVADLRYVSRRSQTQRIKAQMWSLKGLKVMVHGRWNSAGYKRNRKCVRTVASVLNDAGSLLRK
jgi:hypothetical protein